MFSRDDLVHIHKVLHSDTRECLILDRGRNLPEGTSNYTERMAMNKRVMDSVVMMLGFTPQWAYDGDDENDHSRAT